MGQIFRRQRPRGEAVEGRASGPRNPGVKPKQLETQGTKLQEAETEG
jgi:hypothetical protein